MRCEANQSLGQAFSKACGFQRQRLWSAVATAEIPQSVLTSARGEFQNSPVDCFGRGDALSRASPRWAWAHAHAHQKPPKGGWAASFARRGRLPAVGDGSQPLTIRVQSLLMCKHMRSRPKLFQIRKLPKATGYSRRTPAR